MHKKLLALALAVLLICLLCACEEKGSDTPVDPMRQTNPTEEATQDPSEDPTEEPTQEPSQDPTQEPTQENVDSDGGEWVPAGPSGSVQPTEPDGGSTEQPPAQNQEPDTEPTQSEADKNGCEEDVTPWG